MRLALLFLPLLACKPEAPPETPPGPDTDQAVTTPQLPTDWPGTGVLAVQNQPLPAGAPVWANVRAEVLEHDGQRWLAATGVAQRIKNGSLARSTAEARARAELAHWLKTEQLVGSVVKDSALDPGSGSAFARVEIAVANDWKPSP